MNKNDAKKKLTKDQYEILVNKGTEAPFSGELLHNDKAGDYVCALCGVKLFSSNTKFDSGSGWPSFYDVANNKAVKLVDDDSLGMHRTEVQCANCGGHLGHLFHDAVDQPTGDRYCINSLCLNFKPKDK